MWNTYKRWPVYSKFFDNLGPIPHHMHQNQEQAAKLGREGKPESYYFPPQLNWTGNNFPYTFLGLEPGTTKADIHGCLERWNQGDNGILDLSKAYRLKPGTGWLVPPDVLHAPGSLVTYEPQWGSDVFGMYQSMVEGRRVPWELLVKDVPERTITTSTTWSNSSTGKRTSIPSSRSTTTSSRSCASGGKSRGTSTSGSSTARSTASSSSAPAS